jgi:hypothetical protein
VEQGEASCSGDQLRQALQSAAGDGETVRGTPRSEEVRRAARIVTTDKTWVYYFIPESQQ